MTAVAAFPRASATRCRPSALFWRARMAKVWCVTTLEHGGEHSSAARSVAAALFRAAAAAAAPRSFDYFFALARLSAFLLRISVKASERAARRPAGRPGPR